MDRLPRDEASRLTPHLVEMLLEPGDSLQDAGESSSYLYFVLEGVISKIGPTADGSTVEVAMIGRDGVAGALAALGRQPSPLRLQVQLAGRALRVDTKVVREQLRDCGELLHLLNAHVQSLVIQISQSAICNRFHTSEQRLARWLLTAALASGEKSFPWTHELIADMVGGPRSAVTVAAARLRQSGVVQYSRGFLKIRSLRELEKCTCECYRVVARTFDFAA